MTTGPDLEPIKKLVDRVEALCGSYRDDDLIGLTPDEHSLRDLGDLAPAACAAVERLESKIAEFIYEEDRGEPAWKRDARHAAFEEVLRLPRYIRNPKNSMRIRPDDVRALLAREPES